jgi:exopolysaccharide production protein ExoQ
MHCPPQLALIVTLVFVAFLFVRESRKQGRVTSAIWIPFIWLFIGLSRFVSCWLSILGVPMGPVNVEDGSPVDALTFELLIFSGLYVLYQRWVSLGEVLRNNRWLTVFFCFCFVSILWSDSPFVALKRFIKDCGHPIMVLVLLTEPDLDEAVIWVLKRCAFIVVPVSILFIKYYPQWGRTFDSWTGAAANTGISTNKNMLGLDLFILGVFFFWYFLKVWRQEKSKERRNELLFIGLFAYMIGWLFQMAQSSTSLVSFWIAATLMLFLNFRRVNPRHITAYLLGVLTIAVVGEGVFGIYSSILHLLGKSPTLTDRTLLWNHLLQNPSNPILGAGFESYWTGDHIKPVFWPGWSFIPNEAHNGYLETYLNLGAVGLFFLLGLFVVTYRRARRDLIDGLDWGRFRFAFLIAVIFYNWTEAAFKATNPAWTLFFLVMMDYPRSESATVTQPAEPSAKMGATIDSATATA